MVERMVHGGSYKEVIKLINFNCVGSNKECSNVRTILSSQAPSSTFF